MAFTLTFSLVIAAIGIFCLFVWVYVTKQDSESNIKTFINNYYSILFYGLIIVALAYTFNNYFNNS